MLKKLFKKNRPPRQTTAPAHIAQRHEHELHLEQFSRNSVSVVHKLQDAGFQAFLVGGCVRDALLGENPKDYDVATSATPEQVRGLFRNSRIIGRRFKLVHVYHGRELVEVATFRGSHEDGDSDKALQHASGRILRDNVYGTLEEDALRRDFTANALYYDPCQQSIYDFSGGLQDLRQRTLRLIGEPSQRYLEDPVRMLRAIRFAAKLDFELEEQTRAPIRRLAARLKDIPAARLFDESLKLFHSGHALRTFELLLDYNLFEPLFPLTSKAIGHNPEFNLSLIRNAMHNTDERLQQGKSVTPAFLFAALLWPAIAPRTAQLQQQGMPAVPAQMQAAQEVLHQQLQHISIPKRFSMVSKDIWALQQRLPNRSGKRAEAVLHHPRFRAAYDFLLLRESAGENTGQLGQWWTQYQFLAEPQRHAMLRALGADTDNSRRRPRKRRPRQTSGNRS